MVKLTEVFVVAEEPGKVMKLDFDLASGDGVISVVKNAAKKFGIKDLIVTEVGPGGGNPNFRCSVKDEQTARKFLESFIKDKEFVEDVLSDYQ